MHLVKMNACYFFISRRVSIVRNNFRKDKIFKSNLDQVNALIKM